MGELLTNKPLLPGKTESEQISLIFELFGTPNEDIWPDIFSYPLLHATPTLLASYKHKYVFNRINTRVPHVGEYGYDFLNALMMYDPKRRLTVVEAPSYISH